MPVHTYDHGEERWVGRWEMCSFNSIYLNSACFLLIWYDDNTSEKIENDWIHEDASVTLGCCVDHAFDNIIDPAEPVGKTTLRGGSKTGRRS